MGKILALDQSSSRTGLALGDIKGDIRSYRIGLISLPKRDSFGEKLASFFNQLDALIRAEDPEIIFHESPIMMPPATSGIAVQKFAPRAGFLPSEALDDVPAKQSRGFNADTFMKLYKVVGTIELLASLHGIPCESVASATWRRSALGLGRAPKGEAQDWFKKQMMQRAKQLGYSVKDDNEADALGILIHAVGVMTTRNQASLFDLASAGLRT